MAYDSTVSFTLDTICPWTYLALKRFLKALTQYRADNPSSPASYHVKITPYQLYPDFSVEGEDKHEWYKHKRYQGSDDLMAKYETLMGMYGAGEGIKFKFRGQIANTLAAHRLIWWVQERKKLGEEKTLQLVQSLYTQYFEEEKHPSAEETLVRAATEIGIAEEEVKAFLEEGEDGLDDVKDAVRENGSNGIDSVPHIVVEGKRRDFTLTGAKEVDEYLKTLEKVAKESS